MNPALLIIDLQNDYFPGGKMELVEITSAAAKAKQLISFFRQKNWPVVFIQHIALKASATFFLPDSPGVEIHESIQPEAGEKIVIKHFPNSFRDTELHSYLQENGLNDLVICGAMSHMCVDTTTRAAADLGYRCHLIADACATRDLEFNSQTVKAADVQVAYMAALQGTFADVTNLDQFFDRFDKPAEKR